MKKIHLLLLLSLFTTNSCYAAHSYLEKEYQNQWCKANSGVTEYILNDKARVDCLTDEYAIEFDFAKKWAESIGQALYYASATGKSPGVVLIMEKPDQEQRYLNRLNEVAQKYNIKVWTMTSNDMLPRKCKKANTNYY